MILIPSQLILLCYERYFSFISPLKIKFYFCIAIPQLNLKAKFFLGFTLKWQLFHNFCKKKKSTPIMLICLNVFLSADPELPGCV